MSDVVIRMDTSRPYSQCCGERTPQDPLYRVSFWQSFKAGGETATLPFDSNRLLVEDDKIKEPVEGVDAEGKPVLYHPLYTDAMRRVVEAKRQAAIVQKAPGEGGGEVKAGAADNDGDDVNFVAWLMGEERHEWFKMRDAGKQRFKKSYGSIGEMVVDLVIDEQLIPEDQVCPALRKYLPDQVAA